MTPATYYEKKEGLCPRWHIDGVPAKGFYPRRPHTSIYNFYYPRRPHTSIYKFCYLPYKYLNLYWYLYWYHKYQILVVLSGLVDSKYVGFKNPARQ